MFQNAGEKGREVGGRHTKKHTQADIATNILNWKRGQLIKNPYFIGFEPEL